MRKLSEIYQLSSKEMSLVAVFKRPDDDPLQVPLTRPVGLGLPASPEITNPIYRGPSRPTAARPRMPLPMSLPPHPATGVYQLFASSALTPPPASLENLISQAVALLDQNTADTKEKLSVSEKLKEKVDSASLPWLKRRWLKKLCALLEQPNFDPKDWQSLRRRIRAEFPGANIADSLASAAKASG